MNKFIKKLFLPVKNSGFTLIELLVVVLIIGILAAVAVPQYQIAVEKSRAAEGLALLGPLTAAQENYKMANGSYSRDFEALDVSVPFKQSSNKCSLSLGYGGPVSSVEGWDVVLDRFIFLQTPILVLRTEGPFPCYGFFKIDGNAYCTEITGGAPAEVLHKKQFCKKLGGTLEKNIGGWNIYRL